MVKFKIINSNGEEYDIMPKGYNLKNFGYSNRYTYERIGNNYINTLEYLAQGNPKFNIAFDSKTPEKDYIKFINFLQNAPLKLEIYIDKITVYYIDVRVAGVSKEWFPADFITAEVSLLALTPFYTINSYGGEQTLPPIGVDYKRYNYSYDYLYGDADDGNVSANIKSNIDSPVKLEIYGECVNPSWRYYRDGNLIMTGKVNATIPNNQKLVIDTTTVPFSITLKDENDNKLSDMYGYSDFSTERFIFFNEGTNTIQVNDETGINPVAKIWVYEYYASI